MGFEIRELSNRDDPQLCAFLDALGQVSPAVLAYHYPFYREMLVAVGVGEPCYLGAWSGDALVGYLPSFRKRTEVGCVYCSLPYFGPNAGVLAAAGEEQAAVNQALLQHYLQLAEADHALACSVYTPFLFGDFDWYDTVFTAAERVEKFTQYLDLSTADWQQGALGRNIRKAEREGVTFTKEVTPQRLDQFYAIYQQNCLDYGIPLKPRSCLDFLTQPEYLGQHSEIYFADYQGEMIGGLVILHSAQTASYYIPCNLGSARTLQPGVFLIHQAMQEMRLRGVRYWNWESSPNRDSGVYQFKEKWGSKEADYRIYVQATSGVERLREAGQEGIARHFPYFFVYPFNRL